MPPAQACRVLVHAPSAADAANGFAQLRAALSEAETPILVQGLLPDVPPGRSLEHLLAHSVKAALEAVRTKNRTIRIDVSPTNDVPLKLDNGTIILPAERLLPVDEALALLRAPDFERGCRAYARHLDLRQQEEMARELPLGGVLSAAGPLLQAVNLWLGDGSVRSTVHYDGWDNLLLQLVGAKRVLLFSPEQRTHLGYRSLAEHRFIFDEATRRFDGHAPTGGADVANHATLDVFAALGLSAREGEPSAMCEAAGDKRAEDGGADGGDANGDALFAADTATRPALDCTVRAGQALFLPALWSHAVISSPSSSPSPSQSPSPSPSQSQSQSPLPGLNAAVNVWFALGGESHARALRLDPSWAEAHVCRGDNLRAGGRYAEAAAAYESALSLRADYFDAHHSLASAREKLGDLPGAQASYESACALRPADARCVTNLGIVLRRQNKLSAAEAAYRRALSLSPSARAHAALGNVLALQNKLDEALESLDAAVDASPSDAKALNSRGVVREEMGKPADALADFEAAAAAEPGFAKAETNARRLRAQLQREETMLQLQREETTVQLQREETMVQLQREETTVQMGAEGEAAQTAARRAQAAAQMEGREEGRQEGARKGGRRARGRAAGGRVGRASSFGRTG